ncbi:MAG: hypothetical protein COT74_08455 [Bdellovibrionales bacterium CG10_big_fil_rev_8_21_14_0_10_45_34]|nr:MAG: hypothetical protein COT74_08455 [Bdellovibrionales bacterium CG10_big_fil_rev_8_21_14_0_10_45_34]
MKVGMSGITSFTGAWIARDVYRDSRVKSLVGFVRKRASDYDGLAKVRLQMLGSDVTLVEGWSLDSRSREMTTRSLEEIKKARVDVWIHHHHFMESFRSFDYDVETYRKTCIEPLEELVRTLKESGTHRIVYSGSYFEPAEGSFNDPAPTPYAISKAEVWQNLKQLARLNDIELAKVVIPNPVGPLENQDRLIPILINCSRENKVFQMRTPKSVADNLPVTELAPFYLRACFESRSSSESLVFRPSMGGVSNKEFADLVQQELITQRLRMSPCIVQYSDEINPLMRRNSPPDEVNVDWPKFWDFYAKMVE